MIEDDDDIADLERRMRSKLAAMRATPTPEDEKETAMISRLLGTKTAAEQFLRHEARPAAPLGKARTFRPPQVKVSFKYWDAKGAFPRGYGWRIERFENGVKTDIQTGDDWEDRDDLLIQYRDAGFEITPLTVAGIVPEPIRHQPKGKRQSQRASIMSEIGAMTAAEASDFSLSDWEFIE